MSLPSFLSPRDWFDRGTEMIRSRAEPHTLDPATLNWKLSDEELASIRIEWPAEYAWEPRGIWGEQVREALERFVEVVRTDVPQPHDRVISFRAEVDGQALDVAMETSDYPELNEEAYEGSDVHFKMEYALEGYGERDHLYPGGYVNADSVIYRYLPRLRRIRDERPPRFEVYGRYSLSMEKRRKPLEILRGSSRFEMYGGQGKVRYSRYLAEVARARVCIDLPSMSSIPFRTLDYLAIGTCSVGPPHTNQLIRPFQEGVHVAYCKPDYSDLEEVCVHYLENEDERLEMVRNSRAFFDAWVHREQMATYYLFHILRTAEGRTVPADTESTSGEKA